MPVLPEYGLSDQVAIFATSGGDEAPFLASAIAESGATVFAVARHPATAGCRDGCPPVRKSRRRHESRLGRQRGTSAGRV